MPNLMLYPVRLSACTRRLVILNEAKDLASKTPSERGKILRFAQDDKT